MTSVIQVNMVGYNLEEEEETEYFTTQRERYNHSRQQTTWRYRFTWGIWTSVFVTVGSRRTRFNANYSFKSQLHLEISPFILQKSVMLVQQVMINWCGYSHPGAGTLFFLAFFSIRLLASFFFLFFISCSLSSIGFWKESKRASLAQLSRWQPPSTVVRSIAINWGFRVSARSCLRCLCGNVLHRLHNRHASHKPVCIKHIKTITKFKKRCFFFLQIELFLYRKSGK